MEKGDIVWAIEIEQHKHPIVFLKRIDDLSFKACILSTKQVNDNLAMTPEHFEEKDNNGVKYNFQYNNSHLVRSHTFIKKENWIRHGKIAGKLTPKGITFVENHLNNHVIYLEGPIWELNPR